MNHIEFAAHERVQLEDTPFDRWMQVATKLAGHGLDGDQWEDGYSIDGAYDAFRGGQTPEQYVSGLPIRDEADVPEEVLHDEFCCEPGSDCDHSWAYTGTAYGGDDERWMGEGRCYCSKCGADGDA